MMRSDVQADAEAAQRLLLGRARVFFFLVLCVYLAVAGRLVRLQHFEHDIHAQTTAVQQSGRLHRPARRGEITDSRGRPLAVSMQVHSCAFDPELARRRNANLEEVAQALYHALELTPRELQRLHQGLERDRARMLAGRPGLRFVWVRRHLENDVYKQAAAKDLPGVFFPTEYERRYPQKRLAAHVVGFTDIDGKGLEGVENLCDPLLCGLDGERRVRRDAVGRRLASDNEQLKSPVPGQTVMLTLDATIQAILERELAAACDEYKAKSACGVVVDPCSGDVLAMAGVPGYDPNDPTATPTKNRLNQPIATVFEPGSIMKPFIKAAALEDGVVSPETRIFCENGAWRMPNGRVLHDVHGYGWLSAERVLVKSSNIGIAKIGLMLGRESLYRWVKRFGFGEETGFPLPGELAGTVRPLNRWTSYSMGSIPMGQELTVTPLQVALAYGALANGGVLLKPRLVRAIRGPGGELVNDVPVQVRRRVLSARISRRVLRMLRKVVTDGTGKKAKMREYGIGGKTGTAQLAANAEEIAAGARGYSPTRVIGSFVGVAPCDNPRLVVVVSVREPDRSIGHYGGTVAAPAVRNICRETLRYLKVPQTTE